MTAALVAKLIQDGHVMGVHRIVRFNVEMGSSSLLKKLVMTAT